MLELDCRRIQVTCVTVNCAIRQAVSSRAAADQFSVFWSLDFNGTVLFVCMYVCVCVYVYIYIYIHTYEGCSIIYLPKQERRQ